MKGYTLRVAAAAAAAAAVVFLQAGWLASPALAQDKQAREAYQKGSYDEAIRFAVMRLKSKRDDRNTMEVLMGSAKIAYKTHLDAGKIAETSGELDKALKEYEALRSIDTDINSLPPTIQYQKQPLTNFLPKIEVDLASMIGKLRSGASEAHYRAAETAIENKNYRLAQKEFELAATTSFRDARDRAADAKRQGDNAEADTFYQSGRSKMGQQKYREAYADFEKASKIVAGFRDTQQLMAESLDKGKLRFTVAKFINSSGTDLVDAGNFSDVVVDTIVTNKNQFLQVVDRDNLERVMNENKLGFSGLVDVTTAVQAGKLAGVRYIVIGKVVDARQSVGQPARTQQTAYTRRQEQYVDDNGRQRVRDVIGEPRTYYTVQQSMAVTSEANYQIIDVMTGEIANTGSSSLQDGSSVQYAEYGGNPQELHIETSLFGLLRGVSLVDQRPFTAQRNLPDGRNVARDLSRRLAVDIGRKINIFFTRLGGN